MARWSGRRASTGDGRGVDFGQVSPPLRVLRRFNEVSALDGAVLLSGVSAGGALSTAKLWGAAATTENREGDQQ